MDSFEIAKSKVDRNNYFELKYEDLCTNTSEVFKRVLDFCELSHSNSFISRISNYSLRDMNYKWKKDLTLKQKEIMGKVLEDYLKKYDYL